MQKALFLCSNLNMKNELRKQAKNIRKTLNTKILSKLIHKKLINLPEYKNAKNICTYYSFRDEVVTENFFDDKTKNWFIPKMMGDELIICPYDEKEIEINKFNIKEPKTTPINPQILDLIIVPALAADINGYRIGYGKGYYDRLLKNLPNTKKIIIIFSDLLLENVYPDSFDEKCDIIVTDKDTYYINC